MDKAEYQLLVFDVSEEEPRMILFFESRMELRIAYQLISKSWKVAKRFETRIGKEIVPLKEVI